MSAAAIPIRVAAIAMEQNLDRSAVATMVVTTEEGGAIVTFDRNFFVGVSLHNAADAVDVFRNGFILRAN